MQRLLVAFLLFFIADAGKVHIQPFIFEDRINETIESIRPDIPDPLRIDTLTITLPEDEDLLTGSANVSNFELTGLQGFEVTALNLDIFGFRLNFTVNLPSININTDYGLDLLTLNLLPFYGSGRANIHITDGQIQGSTHINLTGGISLNDLRVQLEVGSAFFDIHGALDNEDFSGILSSILNDLVAPFIDEHQELITNVLSPIVEDIINTILNTPQTTTPPPTTTPSTLEPITTSSLEQHLALSVIESVLKSIFTK